VLRQDQARRHHLAESSRQLEQMLRESLDEMRKTDKGPDPARLRDLHVGYQDLKHQYEFYRF
jgi:signal transduction histidine kinase